MFSNQRLPGEEHHTPFGVKERNMASKVRSVLHDMESHSNLFNNSLPSVTPRFDPREIEIGSHLGRGEFGDVYAINAFLHDSDPCGCGICCVTHKPTHWERTNSELSEDAESTFNISKSFDVSEHRELTENHTVFVGETSSSECLEKDSNILISNGREKAFLRAHCVNEGKPLFALKRLRDDAADMSNLWRLGACLDLAREAKFLASLSHPNIIKLRGISGDFGDPDFTVIFDIMVLTLDQAIEKWKNQLKKSKFSLHRSSRLIETSNVRIKQLSVMFDIAKAMQFLHFRNIVYRDLKPENVGFDVRGTLKLFDFGLCKEILNDDAFEMTGLTGSRRYMAPEVVLCQQYGLKADVFSFSILFWEVAALAQPFRNYSPDRHFKEVVLKGKRPISFSVAWMGTNMVLLLKECWQSESYQRPSFSRIVARLRGELLTRGAPACVDNRSMKLTEKSWSSHLAVKDSPSTIEDIY